MFEGKHIHFSPVDNKPLCSYSSKLCRQRRLNGYAFCIRHILEDRSAPFKQCGFVTRNNHQKCLNAIPTNQQRGYCHSHMQVAGIIPKTERKSKNGSPAVTESAFSDSPGETSPISIITKHCNALSEKEKKGKLLACVDAKSLCFHGKKSSLSMNTNSLSKIGGFCKLKTSPTSKSYLTGSIVSSLKISCANSVISSPGTDLNQSNVSPLGAHNDSNSQKNPPANTKSRPSCLVNSYEAHDGKDGCGENKFLPTKITDFVTEKTLFKSIALDPVKSGYNPVYTLCVRDGWKKFRFDSNEDCAPSKSGLKLKLMKAVQVLEKLPLFMEIPVQNTDDYLSQATQKTETTKCFVPSGVEFVLFPPLLNKKKLQRSAANCSVTSAVDQALFCRSEQVQIKNSSGFFSQLKAEIPEEQETLWGWESRKDFLSRVRQAFKRQYKTMMKMCRLKEKMRRNDRAFRSALLSCAAYDTSLCAQILSRDDPFELDSKTTSTLKCLNGQNYSEKAKGFGKSYCKRGTSGEFKCMTPRSVFYSNAFHAGAGDGMTSREEEKSPRVVSKRQIIDSVVLTNQKATSVAHITAQKNHFKDKNKMHTPELSIRKNSGFKPTCSKESERSIFKIEKILTEVKSKNTKSQAVVKRRKLKCNNPSIRPRSDIIGKFKPASKNVASVSASVYLEGDSLNGEDRLVGATCADFPALENLPHSVSTSDSATTPKGVMIDTSFDSPFNHSNSSHRDCDFSDDDLEKSFELQIDPEIAHQASRLLEDNGLTEDDFNELFPETRVGDQKQTPRADMGDLGIDFTSNFDPSDIDYSLFANIFPNFRSGQHESVCSSTILN